MAILRQPVGGLQFVFELLLPLQGFDESFLRQILRVMDVAHHVVNLAENTPQILGDEALVQFGRSGAGFQQRPIPPTAFEVIS